MTREIMVCIRATAMHYATYKKWVVGDPQIRGYQMHLAMRDLMILCTLYRIEAKRKRGLMA